MAENASSPPPDERERDCESAEGTTDTQVSSSASERAAEARTPSVSDSDSAVSESEAVHSESICPECSGGLQVDHAHGETRCGECGLVVAENAIDHGPDWRAFSAAERAQKSHTGSPLTPTQHDRGLTTEIGWRNQDAHGNALSSQQRQQLARLRTWQQRARTRDSKERGLKTMLSEVQRMASALDLPAVDHEVAAVLCRRATEAGLLPGRSYEGMATAAIYAAIRQAGLPHDLTALVRVSRLDDTTQINRTYRYLVRELSLPIPPPDPLDHAPRLCDALDVSEATARLTRQLLDDVIEAGLHSGKHPVGIAAAALYLSSHHAAAPGPDERTQKEIATAANVSEVTLRNRAHEIRDACLPFANP